MQNKPPYALATYVNMAASESTVEDLALFSGVPAIIASKFSTISDFFRNTTAGLYTVDTKNTMPHFKKLIKARTTLHTSLARIDFAKVKNRRTPYQPMLLRDVYKVATVLDECYSLVENEFSANLDDAADYLGTIISDPLVRTSPKPIAIPKNIPANVKKVNDLLDSILNKHIVEDHAKVKDYAPTIQHISKAIELAIKFKDVGPKHFKAIQDKSERIADYVDTVVKVLNKDNVEDTKILKLRLQEAAERTDIAANSISLYVSVHKLISELFIILTYAVEAVTD